MITLITGGARSGKSSYAEMLAAQSGLQVIYIATAHAGDAEMDERIRRHRAHRPAGWITVEEPLALGGKPRTGFDQRDVAVAWMIGQDQISEPEGEAIDDDAPLGARMRT